MNLPSVYIVRHGETAWSISGQHTGLTDIPLTAKGERDAQVLRERLQHAKFSRVFTSSLQRASRTCDLTGFASQAVVDDDLLEWNYGAYEGRTTAEITRDQPGWELFRDGCPDGESCQDVSIRADRVISKIRAADSDVLLFSSGHFLRVLAARWLGVDPSVGRLLVLGTASLSIVSYNHDLSEPVIQLWNDQCYHSQ